MQRRLAAILAADVVGFARAMHRDEAGTLAALKTCEREIIEPKVAASRGRIFKRMGDGYMIEFASAVDLVECAVAWQNAALAREDLGLSFRMGANVGEVLEDSGDLFGDDVNIAARMEALANPASLALTASAYLQVRDRLDLPFHDLGEQEIKNIPDAIRVWEWRGARALPRRLRNARPKAPEKPSIVVLPFRNLSGDLGQDYLAEGLQIDIQNALTQVSGVFLIAHATAYALEGALPSQVSSCTGARYVLQASLRASGNRIRISVELSDGVAGRMVWSERYDRTLDDSFELQDEITGRVLTAINVNLVAGEQARIWHRTLKDLKALELFYKGVHAFNAMERDEIVLARQFFEQVARISPSSPTAPTWIALTYWVEIQRGWSDAPQETRALAREFAEIADAMEYSDGQAQTVLSHVYLMDGDYDAALKAGRRAVTNRPACANANGFYGNVLHYCGEHDAAIHHIELAMKFQPLHPPFFRNVAAASFLAKGVPDRAIEIAETVLEIAPKDITARLIMIGGQVRQGQTEAAKGIADRVMELDPKFSIGTFAETQFYRDDGFPRELAEDLRAAGLPE